jgi:sugar lactone lactonase YvrE
VSSADALDTSGWTVVVAAGSELGERPLWDERSSTVVWVDCLAGLMHRSRTDFDAAVPFVPWSDDVTTLGAPVGSVALRSDGGLVATVGAAFALLDGSGRADADPVEVDLPVGQRFNDGACDPAGRFLAGTTTGAAGTSDAVLWSMGVDYSPRVLLDAVTESNGLGWSPDGLTFYYVDSGEQAVRRYGYDTGSGDLGARLGDLATIEDADGVPDGLVVDCDGGIWLALWQGGSIRRYSPDGEVVATYSLPVDRPTCPALAGPDLDLLVVTTGWEGMAEGQRVASPLSGHLLARRVPWRGLPTLRYEGGAR